MRNKLRQPVVPGMARIAKKKARHYASPLVFPGAPESDRSPVPSLKLHREALSGTVDPVTVEPDKLYASTQEGGQH